METRIINEICLKVTSGGTPNTRKSEYYGGDIPWLKTQEVDFNRIYKTDTFITEEGLKSSSAKWIPENSVIVAMYGATAGRIALNKIPLTTNQACCNLIIDPEKADYRYIYYNLLSRFDSIANMAVGGAQQNLNAGMIKELPIDLPPLPTQKAIAEILSSLDDKIELNNQINQNLEALAQALFKQWFVDFEFPNENGEPYKSSGGEMVDSELGEIPKGWDVGVLSDILDFNPTEKLSRGVASSYLDMSSLPTSGSFPQLPIKRDFSSGMKFRNGDTLLARITPCLENGKTAFIQFLNENEVGWGSTEFIVLRPKANWPKEVGYLIARDEGFRNFAIQNLLGTSGRQRVASSILMNYPIIIPTNKSILEGFGSIVSDLFEKIKANSFENIHLTQLRDTLLPKLISGELEVLGIEDLSTALGLQG